MDKHEKKDGQREELAWGTDEIGSHRGRHDTEPPGKDIFIAFYLRLNQYTVHF